MIEPIDKLFKIAGITLTFDTFTLTGMPNFNVAILQAFNSEQYQAEIQEFFFLIPSQHAVNTTLLVDDIFTMQDNTYIYTFSVASPHVPDLTGISTFKADFVGKELL